EALKFACQVTIHTDSQYVIGALDLGWKRKANHDLLAQADALLAKHDVTFVKVKGHDGNLLNERCDQLAKAEVERQRSKTAEGNSEASSEANWIRESQARRDEAVAEAVKCDRCKTPLFGHQLEHALQGSLYGIFCPKCSRYIENKAAEVAELGQRAMAHDSWLTPYRKASDEFDAELESMAECEDIGKANTVGSARVDFCQLSGGNVVVTEMRREGQRSIPLGEPTVVTHDLANLLTEYEANGYTVRRWDGGARAWLGKPWPIRTASQIVAMRSRNPCKQVDFAFDG
ncbi:MAG: hypothetical protein H8E47_04285, partial [Anaerolineales bacterium]|nr:hypothetical protein [Anaerolineales bacterium]